MAQVLVGEIVFKLKADADNMVRSLRKAAAEVEALQKNQQKLAKETAQVNSSLEKEKTALDNASSSARGMSKSTADLTRDKSRLNQVVTGLTTSLAKFTVKAAVLLPVLRLAAQAITAVGTAAFSLVAALAPLAGAFALYPALGAAVASSMVLVSKALGPVMEAVKNSDDPKKFAEAMKGMDPPARGIVKTLVEMKKALNLTTLAQGQFFPGLQKGLDSMKVALPSVQRAVAMLGTSLGRVAEYAGKSMANLKFLRDFDLLAASNARTVERTGRSLVNFGIALTGTMTAAIPLVDKTTTALEAMSQRLMKAVNVGRENGSLDAFFFRTYTTAKMLGSTLMDVGSALKAISGQGASAMGTGMLQGLEKAAAAFKNFTQSAEGAAKIRGFFAEMGPILSEFGLLIKDVAVGLGQLASGADTAAVFRQIRTELLPALIEFATKASTNIIPAIIDTATALVTLANSFAFGPIVQIISLLGEGLKKLAQVISSLPPNMVTFTAALVGIHKVLTLLAGRTLTGFVTALFGIGPAAQKAATGLLGMSAAARTAAVSTSALTAATATAAGSVAVMGSAAGKVAAGTGALAASAAATKTALGATGVAAAATGGRMAVLAAGASGLLAALGGVPGLALAAAATIGVNLYQATKNYDEATQSAINSSLALIDPSTLNFGPATESLSRHVTEMEKMAKFDWNPWKQGIVEIATNWQKTENAKDNLEATRQAMDEMGVASNNAATNIDYLGRQFGMTDQEVITLANRIGVDLTSAFGAGSREFKKYYGFLGDGSAATRQIIEANGVLNNELSTAAQRHEALNSKLAAAVPNMNAVRGAQVQATQAVAAGKRELDGHKASLDLNTEAGAATYAVFSNMADAVQQEVVTLQAHGRSQEAVTKAYNARRDAIIAIGTSAGLTAPQITTLLKEIGLTPDLVKTLFKVEVEQAKTETDALHKSIRALEKSNPEIKAAANMTGAIVPFQSFLGSVNNSKPSTKVQANVAAGATTMDHFIASINGKRPVVPVEANTARARAKIDEIRAFASRPVQFVVNGVVRMTGRPGAGGVQQADGGIVKFANGGTENHVAQIAPAGAWRLWAEPETGGEAYIPLAPSKRRRSMDILRDTARRMNASVTEFANGSPAPRTPTFTPGSGLARSAATLIRRGGGVEDIQALVRSFRDYINALDQAARRAELVTNLHRALAEANKKGKRTLDEKRQAVENLRSAQKALAEFDQSARVDKEIAATEKLIAKIEAEKEAREKAAEAAAKAAAKKIEIENNMFKVGAMTSAAYIAILDQRIAAEERFTDRWTDLVLERQALVQREVESAREAQVSMENNMFRTGAMALDTYIGILDARIAAEEQFTDRWTSLVMERQGLIVAEAETAKRAAEEIANSLQKVADEAQRVADQRQADADTALANLNQLLDEKIRIEQQIAAEEQQIQTARVNAEIQFNEDMLAATETFNKAVLQAETAHAQNRARLVDSANAARQTATDRFNKASLAAIKTYNSSVSGLLRDRHNTLTGWARLDEQAGPLTALPVAWINDNVKQQIAQFDQWAKMLETARQRGVSEEVIAALNLDAGPQSLGQLQAFAAATDAEIAQLNTLVVTRSQAAGRQVAKEAALTQSALGSALAELKRTHLDEMTELRREHAAEQAEISRNLLIDLAANDAALRESLAAARAAFNEAQVAATARMNEAITSQLNQSMANIATLRTQMAGLGLTTGRTLSEALALGIASGIPGIQAAAHAAAQAAGQAVAASANAINALAAARAAAAAAAAIVIPPPQPFTPQPFTPRPFTPAPAPVFTPPPVNNTVGTIERAANQLALDQLRAQQARTGTLPFGTSQWGAGPADASNPLWSAWRARGGHLFDQGGVLAPGLTMAFNATGKNEYVMTGDQIGKMVVDAVIRSGEGSVDPAAMGGTMVNVYLDGELVRGVARTEVTKGMNDLTREIRAGRR